MATDETTTDITMHGLQAQLVDGRLSLLRLGPRRLGPKLAEQLTDLLTEALRQHTRDQNRSIETALPQSDDADRARVLGWLEGQLAVARASATGARRTGLPIRADGRDQSRRVHVSITVDEVLELEIPAELLADSRATEGAVREAFNQACGRLARDTLDHAVDLATEPPAEKPDWSALARRIEEARQ